MANKRALVTGASRGIGKAISVSLAKAGYDVALAARTLSKGDPTLEHSQSVHKPDTRPLPGSVEETAELVEAAGVKALPLRMDLTDMASVEAACEKLLAEWGGADLVVNNGRHVGPGLMDFIADTPIAEYRKFLEAHGVAPIRITQLLLPAMLAQGSGTFVTISSGAGTAFYPRNKPGQAGVGLGYRIGKAAGHTLVGSILAEHADQGIRAFNVEPGYVVTERNSLDAGANGYNLVGAPPEAVGEAVAWLVDAPEATELMWGDVSAQALALEKGLVPDWRPAAPASA